MLDKLNIEIYSEGQHAVHMIDDVLKEFGCLRFVCLRLLLLANVNRVVDKLLRIQRYVL